MLLFLSRGYFRSRNCLREVYATVEQKKSWVLVHETDVGKGGLTIQASKDECPPELREIIFTQCHYHKEEATGLLRIRRPEHGRLHVSGVIGQAKLREVVPWMRIKDFQLLSLRLICRDILRATPYYMAITQEASLSQGESSVDLLAEGSRAKSERPRALSRVRSKKRSAVGGELELEGLYVPGEVVSLNLSCEHLPQAMRLIHSPHNPGAYACGKEIVRAITGYNSWLKCHPPFATTSPHWPAWCLLWLPPLPRTPRAPPEQLRRLRWPPQI